MKFRCSSIGRLMTEAVSIDDSLITPEVKKIIDSKKRTDEEKAFLSVLKNKTLSVGAKTYIRELAAQEIFGVDFDISSKPIEKGLEVEGEAIELLNRVRGLSLSKNTECRSNEFITGECDLFDPVAKRGHDIKCSWSLATFHILPIDCEDKIYEWQMRGYMALWDAQEWEVNFCMVDTPDRLISFEKMELHYVSNIPEHMRLTTWTVQRDMEKEAAIFEKVKIAREYFKTVIQEFDKSHTAQVALRKAA